MRIREYRENDEKGWVRCRVLSFLDTAYYDNVLREKERYEYPAIELVAEVDGLLVGLLDVELEDDAGKVCSSKETRSGMIWHIAVHPDYQRKGIASALLEEIEGRLKRQGINRLEAWTRDDQWVNNWYVQKGFIRGTTYLHLYLEGPENDGVLESNVHGLRPIFTFAHYTGEREDEVKQQYKRVHECNMYEKNL